MKGGRKVRKGREARTLEKKERKHEGRKKELHEGTGIQARTRDTLNKLHNRALRITLGKDSRYNVWRLHHEAKTPFLNDRRKCHIENFAYKRHLNEVYIENPRRPLRIHDAPVMKEVNQTMHHLREVCYTNVQNIGMFYLLTLEIFKIMIVLN